MRGRLPLWKLAHATTGSVAVVMARRGSAIAGGLGVADHCARKPARASPPNVGGLDIAANGCVGAARRDAVF